LGELKKVRSSELGDLKSSSETGVISSELSRMLNGLMKSLKHEEMS